MPSLSRTNSRFRTPFRVLEGGAATFFGMIDEPDQGLIPPSSFTIPRRILQISPDLPVTVGMVVKDDFGNVFMLGHHGESSVGGFKNFRMFEAMGQYPWQTRSKTIEPVTGLEQDSVLSDPELIWGAYEPTPEVFDRQLRSSFETARFVTNRLVSRDDVIAGRKVERVDVQLGLSIATLG